MFTSPIEAEYKEIEGRNDWLKVFQVGDPRSVCAFATFIFCMCALMVMLMIMLTMVNVRNTDSVIILRRIDFVLHINIFNFLTHF